ncbi:MAG: hypothetical protein ABTD50_10735 [Polyangiaceae bacterium]|jgi:hypothetical protein
MNRWIRKALTPTWIVGALVLVPGGIVRADQASSPGAASARPSWGQRPEGLIGPACIRSSRLSPDLRPTCGGRALGGPAWRDWGSWF